MVCAQPTLSNVVWLSRKAIYLNLNNITGTLIRFLQTAFDLDPKDLAVFDKLCFEMFWLHAKTRSLWLGDVLYHPKPWRFSEWQVARQNEPVWPTIENWAMEQVPTAKLAENDLCEVCDHNDVLCVGMVQYVLNDLLFVHYLGWWSWDEWIERSSSRLFAKGTHPLTYSRYSWENKSTVCLGRLKRNEKLPRAQIYSI